jgi:hypothetical protein
MLTRIQINLSDDERRALQEIPAFEMRGPHEQIRFVLRQDLEQHGLLKVDQV